VFSGRIRRSMPGCRWSWDEAGGCSRAFEQGNGAAGWVTPPQTRGSSAGSLPSAAADPNWLGWAGTRRPADQSCWMAVGFVAVRRDRKTAKAPVRPGPTAAGRCSRQARHLSVWSSDGSVGLALAVGQQWLRHQWRSGCGRAGNQQRGPVCARQHTSARIPRGTGCAFQQMVEGFGG